MKGSGGMESPDGEESGLGFPYWIAVRRRFVANDPFFTAGNLERELLAKQVGIHRVFSRDLPLRKFSLRAAKAVSSNLPRQLASQVVAIDLTEDERHQIQRLEDVGRGQRTRRLNQLVQSLPPPKPIGRAQPVQRLGIWGNVATPPRASENYRRYLLIFSVGVAVACHSY
ncbi:hypothetical protein KSP40_PGU022730 [Platanthera guangdongensis]|uniref:Uncharacterized protein n=1 Tax=Platanthera guangdongensis TaxID=2320717 RepID=A0ABR2MY87_9ASPA